MAADHASERAGLRPLTWMLGIIAAVAIVWLVRAAAIVAIPVVTAFFIAIVMQPIRISLESRLGRLRWAALPLTLLLLICIVGGGIWALAESLDEAVETAPQYSDRARSLWDSAQSSLGAIGLSPPEELLGSEDVQQRIASLAERAARVTWDVMSGLVIVFFFVVLMLLEAPVWSSNAPRLLTNNRGREMLDTIADVADKVRGYLYVRTTLGLASAVAAGIWLIIVGVDLVVVWVVLTFLLNYIPNLGSIIAVVPPSLMAFVQYGPVYGWVTLGGLTIIEQIIGNYIDPRMQGRRLQLSPVIVLAALLFWTWVWGPVGALLAVPVTVTLLAAAARSPALRPFAELAAAEEDGPAVGERRAA